MAIACVAGGAGFIGSALVRRLHAAGHTVRVLDDLSTGEKARVAGLCEFHKGDVCEDDLLYHVLRGVEVVYHLAAIASVPRSLVDPMEVHRVNVTGTLTVLESARLAKVRRLVFASSASVYGDTDRLPTPEDAPFAPRSPYAASKAAAESYVRAYAASGLLPTVALRFGNVYGPGQSVAGGGYSPVVPAFVAAAKARQPATFYGDGLQTRDFIALDDVVSALVASADKDKESGVAGEAINVGSGVATTLRDVWGLLAAGAAATYKPVRAGDLRHSLLDVRRMRERLGVEPMSLADGLRRTLA